MTGHAASSLIVLTMVGFTGELSLSIFAAGFNRPDVPRLIFAPRQNYSEANEGGDNRGKDECIGDRHGFLHLESS